MTAPDLAAHRLLWGLLLGAQLGLVYEFLRPLRSRHHAPADLLFVGFGFWVWVWYSFQICAGAIRLGATVALMLGTLLTVCLAGKLLRKLFFPFWRGIFHIFSQFALPVKKFFEKTRIFSKKVFASGKKRGTIERIKHRHHKPPLEDLP
jgi:hypothetical protein